MPSISDIGSAIPKFINESTLQFVDLLYPLYASLSLDQRNILNASDIILPFVFCAFLYWVHSPRNAATFGSICITLGCIVVTLGAMWYFYAIIAAQQHNAFMLKNQALLKKGGEPITFAAKMPLDMQIGLTYPKMTEFMAESGPKGRLAYSISLFLDFFFIAAYTFLGRQLASVTLPSGVNSKVIKLLTFALAAIDMYETLCFATMLYYWSDMVNNAPGKLQISHSFVDRAGKAIAAKFTIAYLLVGMHCSALVQYYVDLKYPVKVDDRDSTRATGLEKEAIDMQSKTAKSGISKRKAK